MTTSTVESLERLEISLRKQYHDRITPYGFKPIPKDVSEWGVEIMEHVMRIRHKIKAYKRTCKEERQQVGCYAKIIKTIPKRKS